MQHLLCFLPIQTMDQTYIYDYYVFNIYDWRVLYMREMLSQFHHRQRVPPFLWIMRPFTGLYMFDPKISDRDDGWAFHVFGCLQIGWILKKTFPCMSDCQSWDNLVYFNVNFEFLKNYRLNLTTVEYVNMLFC